MANFNFNKVILGGRLTADPELKTTPSGVSVTSFTIAVNRRFSNGGEQQADFFNITAWRQTAEFITRYFRKASSICIVGSIQTRSWTDQNGQKRFATEIVADEAYFVDAKSESPLAPQQAATMYSQGGQAAAQQAPAMPQPTAYTYIPEAYTQTPMTSPAAAFEQVPDDDELPF